MNESDLTKGSIRSHFRTIALPASVGFLFNTLYNVVDSFYAGRLGTDVLAGMAISFPIFFLILSISSGLGNGATALSAISIGQRSSGEKHYIVKNAMYLTLIFGILLPILSPFILKPLFSLAGAEGSVLQVGLDYTNMIMYGSMFFIANNVFAGILSSEGNTKPFRNYLIVGFIANLILDPLFIFGWFGLPRMGASGVALATVIIQFGGSIYLMIKMFNSTYFSKSLFGTVTFRLKTIIEILKQGIPSTLNVATIALGVFIINYFVLLYGGSNTVAAYGVSMRIEQLALIPTIGLNIAVLSIVGQNFGAKDIERVKEARYKGTKYGVIIMLVGTVLIVPLAPYLIAFFDNTREVVDAGTTYLRIEAIAFTTYVFLNINVSTLQGIKKPQFAVWIGVYRQIIPLGLFYLLGTTLGMGIYGVWWGIVIINWSAVLISWIYTKYMLNKVGKDLVEGTIGG